MSEDQGFSVSVIWPDVEDLPVMRVNQWIAQIAPGPDGTPEDLILAAGIVTPPVVLGPPEEQQALMRSLSAVKAKTVVRLSLSKERARELAMLLSQQVAQWDEVDRGGSA